jgi:predicted N-formylglutamate amidohydrolase
VPRRPLTGAIIRPFGADDRSLPAAPTGEPGVGESSRQVLVSCEHASNRLPRGFDLDPALLELHIAWDPGALPIAERLSRRLGAPLWRGKYSRLVADLNRTVGNRMLMRKVSDGHRIPFNYGVTDHEREDRIDRYYRPYREGVAEAVEGIIRREGRCVHIAVHTFTPVLAGRGRRNDIGLLHDPSWGIERDVCADLREHIRATTDYVVWFNRPYSGTADGILPALRRAHSPGTYVGIELEINQKYAGDHVELRRIADVIAQGFERSRTLEA